VTQSGATISTVTPAKIKDICPCDVSRGFGGVPASCC
jgi:hypothetical protein